MLYIRRDILIIGIVKPDTVDIQSIVSRNMSSRMDIADPVPKFHVRNEAL